MSVRRSIGLETEFGIVDAMRQENNAIVLSSHAVTHYANGGSAAGRVGGIPWDYHGEDPLNDARGFRMTRASAHPSQLTDDPAALAPSGEDAGALHSVHRPSEAERKLPHPASIVLTNGARFYVDHAHPEYSAPEVINPRETVLWDRAGELIAQETMDLLAQAGKNYVFYKNNVDGKGAAYGTHENYQVKRDVPFTDIIRYLTPFFVTRPIICGAGRVGLGQRSEKPGFQISQRADYVENDVGIETTFNRPIINTRDEPHGDAHQFRRFHVIGGDANQFDVSNLLKVGTTSLVLWLVEQGDVPLALDSLMLYDPVRAAWEVSHDPTLRTAIDMHDGSSQTAIAIQQIYLDTVREALHAAANIDYDTAEILHVWQEVLDALRTDMFSASDRVEWIAKYSMLEGIRRRGNLSWDNDKLRAFDLQWHDLRPERSIVHRLDSAGGVKRIFTSEQVAWAKRNAPESTRAYLRGGVIKAFPHNVAMAGWDGITFDIPGRADLLRMPLNYPTRATRSLVGEALTQSASIEEFLAALATQ
ncbi:MAG: depupylase/deamidase Dop [Actinomycetaceae bacterium]|nr:proteasome accessory factor PafA2 [Arcanobacterium sp.]MDD7504464.1 depupylase/deamidase Dop [Actinomycetaceae bacterium]MDY6143978.1 depupylase/deamidase Dop [Arcanobacterium sp.]